MKRLFAIASFLLVMSWMAYAQEAEKLPNMLIGGIAPSFKANSTEGMVNFPEAYGRKWKILFSHPADFTPVCSSEILELAAAKPEFDKLNVQLVVVSTDSLGSHLAWKKSLEGIRFHGNDPVNISFPLVDDYSRKIAKTYGMLHPTSSTVKDVRGVFIIDPANKLAAIFYYPNNIGRNIEEIERTVVALQTANDNAVYIPANWKPGSDVLVPYLNSRDETVLSNNRNDPNYYEVAWYMWYKKLGMAEK
jgi:peroxiredoxin (alkyl hydroperoxide reductase subunit C)